jgi:outer membrane protein
MSRRFLPLLVVLLALPLPSQAEEGVTLEAVVQRAVQGNLDLMRQRFDIEVARARLESARGQFDLVLGADLKGTQTRTPERFPSDLAQGKIDFFAGTQTDLTGGLRLMRPLETGGQVGLALSFTRTQASSPLTSGNLGVFTGGGSTSTTTSNSFWQVPLTLTVSQSLLRGLGPDVATIQIRRAALLHDVELLRRAQKATDVVRDVVGAYWDLCYLTRDLDIRRGALELAKDQLRQMQDQLAVGRVAILDLAAVEAAISDRTEQVVLGEQLLVEQSLRLRRLSGESIGPSSGALRAATLPEVKPRGLDRGTLVRQALAQNPALLTLRLSTRASELDVQAAESALRPQLDFAGSFGSLGRKDGGGDALAEALKLSAIGWSAGLTFSLPLQNRTAHGSVEAARLNLRRGAIDISDLEAATAETVLRLTTALETARRRIEVTREGTRAAGRSLEAERARFDVGRATQHDLLKRQEELEVAQLREARAATDYLRAEAALLALTGELLDHLGISLRGRARGVDGSAAGP